jgi:hypothetical protein
MTSGRECDDFAAGLGAYLAGRAAPDTARQFEAHLATCGDCATLLALERRLAAATTADLEAAVPEALVAGLWERLEPQLPRQLRAVERRRPWYARPALAWAASLALLLGNGMLAGEVLRTRRHVDELAAALAPAREGAAGASWLAVGAAGLPRGWGELTVGEAIARLDQVPESTLLLGPEAAGRWLAELPRIEGVAARAWLRRVKIDDGLQAGEARALLGGLRSARGTPLRRLLPASFVRAAQRV